MSSRRAGKSPRRIRAIEQLPLFADDDTQPARSEPEPPPQPVLVPTPRRAEPTAERWGSSPQLARPRCTDCGRVLGTGHEPECPLDPGQGACST
jgi:hypothetical protein